MEKIKVILLSQIEELEGNDRVKADILHLISRNKLKVWNTDRVEL
jgi:hypothetical protein